MKVITKRDRAVLDVVLAFYDKHCRRAGRFEGVSFWHYKVETLLPLSCSCARLRVGQKTIQLFIKLRWDANGNWLPSEVEFDGGLKGHLISRSSDGRIDLGGTTQLIKACKSVLPK